MTAEFPLAVHALVYLAHTERVTSSAELADNICTNPARVRKVMAKLHRAGLLEAGRGQKSGYLTRSDASALSLRTVLEALEEPVLSLNWRSGDMDRDCLVSSGMGAIMDRLYGEMNQACLQFLEQQTIGTISHEIFTSEEAES